MPTLGEGYATEKLDGTCCMIKDNKLYRRYDYKEGRKLPTNAIPCQPNKDTITGHWPHWLLCDRNNPSDKYHFEAFDKNTSWEDGTYELIVLHEQGNPYKLDTDILEKHGKRILTNAPRTYEGLKEYLNNNIILKELFFIEITEKCVKSKEQILDLNGKNNFEFSFCVKFNF